MKACQYVYLYGMVMSTESFLLKYDYPKADGYCEIKEKYHLIGGETGTAAVVLANLGVNVKLGGTHLGRLNKDVILSAFKDNKNVDTSELVCEDFDGIVDHVLVDKNTRTCFGEWEKHFSREKPFYEPPCEESVKNCRCVGADPFFGEDIARLAVKYGKPYAAIDCEYDGFINRHCEINAVSHQFLEQHYPDKTLEELHRLYTENTDGLVIFTRGEKELMYGRKGQSVKYMSAFPVDTVSTLGAGDCFKAGTVCGLFMGMSDDKIVEFAAAAAAAACTKFPIPLSPPGAEEIERLINAGKR